MSNGANESELNVATQTDDVAYPDHSDKPGKDTQATSPGANTIVNENEHCITSSDKLDSVAKKETTDNKDVSKTNDRTDTAANGNSSDAGSTERSYNEMIEYLRGLGISGNQTEEKHEKVLSSLTVEGIADYINAGKCKNIIVMTGAGISTSAGIPDFRSPGTGLYSKLEKYNLPYPQAIFELEYFKTNPEPFFLLAKELYPGNFKPTPSHYFIKLLEKKNLLLRNYTQNIDGLELVSGVRSNLVIAAHGTFYTSHCVDCEIKYDQSWMKAKIFASEIPRCKECNGLVKPDIVFFGESLPNRFFQCMGKDFRKADLLIVMGTSLTVQPFASLINRVGEHVPRLLINKEKCGQSFFSGGFNFEGENNYRDVASLGSCDDGCRNLAKLLGLESEFESMINGKEVKGESSDGSTSSL